MTYSSSGQHMPAYLPRAAKAKLSKYQLHPVSLAFPWLPKDDLDALSDDIKKNGLREPITRYQGQILDGRNRLAACLMAGVKPRFVDWRDDDGSAIAWAISKNLARRHLTASQRAAIALDLLPMLEAEAKERQREGGRVAHQGATLPSSGKAASFAAALTHASPRGVEECKAVQRRAPELIEPIRDGTITVREAKRVSALPKADRRKVMAMRNGSGRAKKIPILISKMKHAARATAAKNFKADVAFPDSIKLYCCPFQKLEKVAKLKPSLARLVMPDVPYDGKFLPQIEELASLAKRWLEAKGVLALVSGQYYLPQVLAMIGKHLTWRWQGTLVWNGDANLIRPLDIMSQWKPIHLYSKGDWQKQGRWSDVFYAEAKDKELHEQQLPLNVAEDLVRYLTKPGDLVIDPCAGSFTVAIACYRLGRRFIGCDINADYVAIGRQRLAEEIAAFKKKSA